MGDVTARNFGLLVAYLIPGFIALCGVGFWAEPVRLWLWNPAGGGPTVGAVVYVTLGSLAAGMTASAVRWALLDTLNHRTGIPQARFNDAVLERKLEAFTYLVENHYRYYQFYGNCLVAVAFAYAAWRYSPTGLGSRFGVLDVGILLIEMVFIAGSRDALRKYYRRASVLLAETESEAEEMTNGNRQDIQDIGATSEKAARETSSESAPKIETPPEQPDKLDSTNEPEQKSKAVGE